MAALAFLILARLNDHAVAVRATDPHRVDPLRDPHASHKPSCEVRSHYPVNRLLVGASPEQLLGAIHVFPG